MKGILYQISLVLTIIGGLNWGLVGLFDFDLVAAIFGAASVVSKVVYVLIGLGALYMIYAAFAGEKKGQPSSAPTQPAQ
jgi:uncharacterized membrane protein YuzA (DUF378 family)